MQASPRVSRLFGPAGKKTQSQTSSQTNPSQSKKAKELFRPSPWFRRRTEPQSHRSLLLKSDDARVPVCGGSSVRNLTATVEKPSFVVEQASSCFSFRFSELGRPI